MNVLVRHGLISILVAIFCLSLLAVSPLYAQSSQSDSAPVSPIEVPNPGSELWRSVRERSDAEAIRQDALTGILQDVRQQQAIQGKTQVRGADAGSLVNTSGDQWRQLRTEQLIPRGGMLLLIVGVFVGALFFIKTKPHYTPSNQFIRRFSVSKVVGHWLMAASMLFLAFTGLVLLFGRYTLLPVTGSEFFAVFASASKEGHDLFGPVFTFALIVFFIQFVSKNLPSVKDIIWTVRLGGLIGKKPVQAGFFNFGEKVLFWLVILFGVLLSVSGFAILFQNLVPGRDLMQLATLVHAVSAILLVCLVIGHIYMAISVKGTMDAMSGGNVDAEWARAHHGSWYFDMKEADYIRTRIDHSHDQAPSSEVSAENTG